MLVGSIERKGVCRCRERVQSSHAGPRKPRGIIPMRIHAVLGAPAGKNTHSH